VHASVEVKSNDAKDRIHVCVCVRVCARACVRVRVRVYARACTCVHACITVLCRKVTLCVGWEVVLRANILVQRFKHQLSCIMTPGQEAFINFCTSDTGRLRNIQ
jgi:hypothetical protein